ncbi:MAG: pyrroloquinoline quinone biosynthesis protein PqqE [Acidobacteriaceae bacterium]|nr:pyrroloquinoline quinone biosynthesis protein PqqE [Acidobacteriaceae bacterium]
MISPPQALIAEITHRCPLHCVYCSNPLQMQPSSKELSMDKWRHIIQQAAEMGCLHLHLTGGEPLLRRDTEDLVRAARASALYVNLITSGLGLTPQRLRALVESGLDHIQLSFQDSEEAPANTFAGTSAHAHKLRVASWIREHRIAFTVNVVIHQQNIDRLEQSIRLAEQLRADKLEIANVQYYGWALRNRAALLPSADQLRSSRSIIESARARLAGKMRIDYVLPDYYAKFPKPCMGGWGRALLLVDPAGRAMPCHSATVIPGFDFPNAASEPLSTIWERSPVFQRFRGDAWMQEPCRSCERKTIDFGGCRCQALLLTGDPAATDPVCSLSPKRSFIDELITAGNQPNPAGWVYRIDPARF